VPLALPSHRGGLKPPGCGSHHNASTVPLGTTSQGSASIRCQASALVSPSAHSATRSSSSQPRNPSQQHFRATCSVSCIYGAAQAVALASRAAGTPFDPRSLDLPSIGALVGFYHACLGFPVKQIWLDAIKAGNCDTFEGLTYSNAASIVQMQTKRSWAILPSNAKMSGRQNPSSQRQLRLWFCLLLLLHLPTAYGYFVLLAVCSAIFCSAKFGFFCQAEHMNG
jgi:hypothetical protein